MPGRQRGLAVDREPGQLEPRVVVGEKLGERGELLLVVHMADPYLAHRADSLAQGVISGTTNGGR